MPESALAVQVGGDHYIEME